MQTRSNPVPPPTFSTTDIGVIREEFNVRDSLNAEDSDSYQRVEAKLWAIGNSVNIWVDVNLPIDWDYECDGVIDEVSPFPAYGFDNCDLVDVANIVDINIFPNVADIFGDVSDINSDGKVTILITPVLNKMSQSLSTSSDTAEEEEEEEDTVVKIISSFALPGVDLEEYDPSGNALSDEQEIIYLYAPDPYGFHNPDALVPVDSYTQIGLGSSIWDW